MKSALTHRERVLAALNHQEPDRVPVDIAGAKCTTLHRVAYQNLIEHLGLPPRPGMIWDSMQQAVLPEEDVLRHFDVDTRSIWAGAPDGFKPRDLGRDFYEDEWGVVRVCPKGGYYFDLHKCPLEGNPTLDDLEHFPWPDPDNPGRVRGVRERAEYLRQKTDYAVVLNLGATLLHTSQYMRGFEGWFKVDGAVPEKIACSVYCRPAGLAPFAAPVVAGEARKTHFANFIVADDVKTSLAKAGDSPQGWLILAPMNNTDEDVTLTLKPNLATLGFSSLANGQASDLFRACDFRWQGPSGWLANSGDPEPPNITIPGKPETFAVLNGAVKVTVPKRSFRMLLLGEKAPMVGKKDEKASPSHPARQIFLQTSSAFRRMRAFGQLVAQPPV